MDPIFDCCNGIVNPFPNSVGKISLNNLIITCTILNDCILSKNINKTTGLSFSGFIFKCIHVIVISDDKVIQRLI